MTTPYQQIIAQCFLSQMGTGAALVLSQILIPTITANLGRITRQTCNSRILLRHGLHGFNERRDQNLPEPIKFQDKKKFKDAVPKAWTPIVQL